MINSGNRRADRVSPHILIQFLNVVAFGENVKVQTLLFLYGFLEYTLDSRISGDKASRRTSLL